MSRKHLDVVHQAIAAFNRHDIEAIQALSDDDFEFVSVLTAVDSEAATYRGPAAWTDYFARMDETWRDWTAQDVQVFEGADGEIATMFRIVGTGRVSGAAVERLVGVSYLFRAGKLWRMRSYMNPRDALTAIGAAERL